MYLGQIGKVGLLNAEQEVELSKRIEAGLYAEKILEIVGTLPADEPEQTEEDLTELVAVIPTPREETEAATDGIQKQRTPDELVLENARKVQHKPQTLRDLKLLADDGKLVRNLVDPPIHNAGSCGPRTDNSFAGTFC